MAEVNDPVDPIDPIDPIDPVNDPDGGDDERTLALKHFGIDPDNLDSASTDDLLAIAIRGYKAEQKKIQEKRERKQAPKSETPSDVMTKADYAMERFLEKNPEMSDYKNDLESYMKKGLSLDEAKVLVKSSDKTTANREKLTKARISDSDASATSMKSEYTRAEVDRMAESDPTQYAKVADLLQSGKARLR